MNSSIHSYTPRTKWQADVVKLYTSEPVENQPILWFVDNGENPPKGKTTLCRYFHDTFSDVAYSCNTTPSSLIKQIQTNTKLVLFDLFRSFSPRKCRYDLLEHIRDGYVTVRKKTISWAPPHIVVFSYFEPDYTKIAQYKIKCQYI